MNAKVSNDKYSTGEMAHQSKPTEGENPLTAVAVCSQEVGAFTCYFRSSGAFPQIHI